MGYGEKLIKLAKKQLGNGGKKYWKSYGAPQGTSWCCIFMWWLFKEVGIPKAFYSGKKVAYVPTIQEWLERNCKHVKMANAKPGDIVIFTWDGDGYNDGIHSSRDHIGMIRKAGTSSVAYTIEGNTKNGVVAKRTRAVKWIMAIYRPNYPKAKRTIQKPKTKKPALKPKEREMYYAKTRTTQYVLDAGECKTIGIEKSTGYNLISLMAADTDSNLVVVKGFNVDYDGGYIKLLNISNIKQTGTLTYQCMGIDKNKM